MNDYLISSFANDNNCLLTTERLSESEKNTLSKIDKASSIDEITDIISDEMVKSLMEQIKTN